MATDYVSVMSTDNLVGHILNDSIGCYQPNFQLLLTDPGLECINIKCKKCDALSPAISQYSVHS